MADPEHFAKSEIDFKSTSGKFILETDTSTGERCVYCLPDLITFQVLKFCNYLFNRFLDLKI